MKFVHIVVALLFALFAYFQLNDPDPLGWVLLYLGISVVAVLAFLGRSIVLLPLVGTFICVVGMLFLVPDFIAWVKDGMPTITGSMKAESLYIELVREFLGLTIAGVAYFLYFRSARKLDRTH